MAHKSSKEYELIIKEVIDKFLSKKHNYKKCKYFDAIKMARYIEGKLNDKEKKSYEKHLYNCEYCFTIYNNIENDIEKFYKIKFFPVMDNLIEKAFNILEKDIDRKKKENNNITIKLLKTGFEIISISNVTNIFPEFLPALRDKEKERLISLKIENIINESKLYITVEYQNEDYINLKINIENLKNFTHKRFIRLVSSKGEIRKNISENIVIDNIIKDSYKIFIDKLKIISLNIE